MATDKACLQCHEKLGADVNAHGITVDGGRRVAVNGGDPALAGVLRYALARADPRLAGAGKRR